MTAIDSFKCRRTLKVGKKTYDYYSLPIAEKNGLAGISTLPFSMKVLLENLIRFEDGRTVKKDDIKAIAEWVKKRRSEREIAFRPARVLMQDFTGVPAVVDLAAMRDAMKSLGGDPKKINPLVPVDLVIDHSVIVDHFGTPRAFKQNVDLEYKRNLSKQSSDGARRPSTFRVVRPAPASTTRSTLNIYRARYGRARKGARTQSRRSGLSDTLVGADSHTTMVNGLWCSAGRRHQAGSDAGPAISMIPEGGFRLASKMKEGSPPPTSFSMPKCCASKRSPARCQFYGLAWRAFVGSRHHQHVARVWRTCGFFPSTKRHFVITGTARHKDHVALVAVCKAQGLYHTKSALIGLHRHAVARSRDSQAFALWPQAPQDHPLSNVKAGFARSMDREFKKSTELVRFKVDTFDLGQRRRD